MFEAKFVPDMDTKFFGIESAPQKNTMKLKYYLLFLLGTSLVMAELKEMRRDPFDVQAEVRSSKETQELLLQKRDAFDIPSFSKGGVKDGFAEEENRFSDDSMHVFEIKLPRAKELLQVVSERKVTKNNEKIVEPSRTQDAMLKINKDDIKVNYNIYNDELCRDTLLLTEYLYLGTKRCDRTHTVYPNAWLKNKAINLLRPPNYETIKNRGIEIYAPIYGTNGGAEGAIVAMLAYRRTPGHLEIFVVLEGSQGESFEFLGGFGGASWRSNLQSGKTLVDAEDSNLDKKYGKLSFHKGYGDKINSLKIPLKNETENLLSDLNIKDFSEFNMPASGRVTQQDVDNWRGFTVDIYIFGHSQGGGLAQAGAAYIAYLFGKKLYGDSFDNRTFNIVHVICLSPARAFGDKHTMEVLLKVLGDNIFGWCSPIDVVPCLPLGNNIDKRPLEKIRAKIFLVILKAISIFLPKDWSELIAAISSTEFNYETLPVFAYVDYAEVLKKYCEIGQNVYNDYLNTLKKAGAKGETKEIEKKIEHLKSVKKQIPKIKKDVEAMQENYFKAHTSNWITSKYYGGKAAYYLGKVLKKVSPMDLIASQHWGIPVKLQNPNDAKNIWIDNLFGPELIDTDIQKSINRGTKYERDKRAIIGDL